MLTSALATNAANGGSCVDGVNNYSCNCLVGFTGGHCETGQYTFVAVVCVVVGTNSNKI